MTNHQDTSTEREKRLASALWHIKYKAVSLADAQVIALEALASRDEASQQPQGQAVSDEQIIRCFQEDEDDHTDASAVRIGRRAILALRQQAVTHEDWPLRAKVWRRDSTSEWVLEISGTLCDTYMHCRHTQPLSVQFEDVPGLPTLYEDAQAVPMTGGWQDVKDCPDGDVWFALSCGHVVMGWKQGPLVLDWEASIDHDCCYDASAIKCQAVAVPAPPAQRGEG